MYSKDHDLFKFQNREVTYRTFTKVQNSSAICIRTDQETNPFLFESSASFIAKPFNPYLNQHCTKNEVFHEVFLQ